MAISKTITVITQTASGGAPWLHFWETVLPAYAWPIALCFFIWLFRKNIAERFDFTDSIKIGAFEAKFRSRLADAQQAASNIPDAFNNVAPPLPDPDPADSPRLIVLDTWTRLERSLQEVANAKGLDQGSSLRRLPTLNTFVKNQVLDADTVEAINGLRSLRNAAAHDPQASKSITKEDAENYRKTASIVESVLRRILATGV